MAGPNEVLLVRHGETDENAAARFQGRIDTRLNERGREQSHALARELRHEGIAALYSSPLLRARETAQIVADALGLEAVLDERLVEADAGDWSGRMIADILAHEAAAYARWRAADPAFRFPGGESVAEQTQRIAAALADVAAGPLPALVVTHGGTIRAVEEIDVGPTGKVANCQVFRLDAVTPAPSFPAVTRTARIAFAVLVCATFGAFFAAQELKTRPPEVQEVTRQSPYFSPNRDGRFDRARIAFELKQADDVTATVVDRDDDVVTTLVDDRRLRAGQRLRLVWDGTDGRNRAVPDGTYRIRLNLRRQGRAVLIPRNITKDTKPPEIVVDSIGPSKTPGPELLPNAAGEPAQVNFSAPGRRREVLVYRTDVRPARAVFDKPVRLADDARNWEWDGTADGRRLAAGTYVVVVRARDAAGNIGASVPEPPRTDYGRPFPGRGGITIRYLRAQGPSGPVTAGETVRVAVESPGARFQWRLRRVGDSAIARRGSGTRTRVVRFRAPGGKSGLYLFEVTTRTRRTATPVVVRSETEQPVLVVLPATTWQGLNPADDDGDGQPDTLAAGLPVRLARPYVKDGLPPQIRRHEALLLSSLDRKGRRYDLTTDVALARGEGPELDGRRGVIIAGDARWLDASVARTLRGFVRAGGKVLSLGTRSLQRTVTQTPGLRAIAPTQPTRRDLFGARLRSLARPPAPVTLVNVVDKIDLFAGTAGQFDAVATFEETVDVRGGSDAVAAAAATQDGERSVIVAARLGQGLVIRTGMPEFSASLRERPELLELLDRLWTLLRSR